MVIPERETPGINANAWDNPIVNVCFNVISSYFTLFFAFLSTIYNTIPITINAIAIIIGIFKAFWQKWSNKKPIAPPGIVASTMYQNIRPWTVFSFFTAYLYPPFISSIQSLKNTITIASKVPKCNATSNPEKASEKPGCFIQSNIHGIIFKCAELDIGSNSVIPWTTPKIKAWYISIIFSPFL